MGALKLARRSGSRGQSVVEFALVLPIMVVLLFAIVDFARIYTTMMSIESAAREAADYGTELGAAKWLPDPDPAPPPAGADATVVDMREHACIAASDLPDYSTSGGDEDADGVDDGCTNPSFAYCVTPADGAPCGSLNPADGCEATTREPPCKVTVTLTYNFRLLAPLNIEVMGVRYGVPPTIAIQRDSTYAMTDIQAPPTP
jgi:hypothetical protein